MIERMRRQNPWVMALAAIAIAGLLGSPFLLASYFDSMTVIMLGGVSSEQDYANWLMLNSILMPVMLTLVLGSALSLLAVAAIRRARRSPR